MLIFGGSTPFSNCYLFFCPLHFNRIPRSSFLAGYVSGVGEMRSGESQCGIIFGLLLTVGRNRNVLGRYELIILSKAKPSPRPTTKDPSESSVPDPLGILRPAPPFLFFLF